MFLKYAEILNFDSIIREWIEIANELFGTRGCIGINDPGISPYREPGAMKTLVSLLGVMRTILDRLPENKKMEFENRCREDTQVWYGLKEVCDVIDNTRDAI